ncbi:MAG TPA: protein kinase [Actinospica sp.]|nr:protein kinase [Actinospica sp.]
MTDIDSAGPVQVPTGYRVGRWRVGELLGYGGWGSVYAGESGKPGEAPVALKFLPPARIVPAQRSLLAEVVEREAEFSRLADHTNLMRAREVLTVAEPEDSRLDGAVVLVMDRAETNLRQLLVDHADGVALEDADRLLVEVCRALSAMHERGWIHGDLKPGNVLLMADGTVRLADFGLTAQVEGTHAYVPRIGSSDYLPPEWWSERVGERGIPQRPSTDVWAFGVLAHQVLTGGLYPFPGTSAQTRAFAVQSYARGTATLHLDERIPAPWRKLIAECLTPDQKARGDIGVAHVLDRAEAIRRGGTPPPVARRHPLALAAACALAVLTATGGALWLTSDASPSTAAPQGRLGPHAAVPAQYRDMITLAADRYCAEPAVSPALLAAILKVESNFDPNFSSPDTASFGIAGWTPSVFRYWMVTPKGDYMNPKDAMPAVARFLCWLDERFTQAKVPGDMNALLAAGYDTSDAAVIEAKGVPPEAAAFAASAVRYTSEFEL